MIRQASELPQGLIYEAHRTELQPRDDLRQNRAYTKTVRQTDVNSELTRKSKYVKLTSPSRG